MYLVLRIVLSPNPQVQITEKLACPPLSKWGRLVGVDGRSRRCHLPRARVVADRLAERLAEALAEAQEEALEDGNAPPPLLL